MRTKSFYAERVLNALQNDFRNIDFKIDEREIFLDIDAVVNELAAKSYFENWKLAGGSIDEGFLTTWEPVTVVDQENELPSYFVFPSNYAVLPRNEGINQIYPIRFNTENQSPVVVISHADYRRYLNNPARGFGGRLAGYPKGDRFYFIGCKIKKNFGDMGVTLVVRDSGAIGDDDPYPIPSDKEDDIINRVIEMYRSRRMQPTDSVRDNKDSLT